MALMAMAVGCSRSRDTADEPASVAERFVALSRGGNCPEAYALYSASSKDSIGELSRRMLAGQSAAYIAQFGDKFAPDHLDCGIYAEYLPTTVREVSRAGDSAIVSVTSRTGSWIPIPFFSDPIKESTVKMRLVREDGAWRIVHPMADRRR